MKNEVREAGSFFRKEKKIRVDEERARDGGLCNEEEKWRAGMHKGKDVGPWKFPLGLA